MVTGWMLFTGTDTKGRRLLYIKKKNAYYLLPQHREFAITLWKHAEINAISISIILGYFLFHKIAGTIALALVLYAVELLIMNKKLLPSLHRAGGSISHGVKNTGIRKAAAYSLHCCFYSSVSDYSSVLFFNRQ
ncbi:MAG: hypothetical protein ACLTQJ_06430 [[Clostridium] innocuum]